MKKINNTKSEVFLSTYDDSDILLPVSEEHKNLKNVCVAVKFGDIVVKISPKNTCQYSWDEAMNEHRGELAHSVYWQMVGSVYREVNQAIEMLGHGPIGDVWTDTEDNDVQCSGNFAWRYYGSSGSTHAYYKLNSSSVRAAKVFKID